jgi:hypothetical protein
MSRSPLFKARVELPIVFGKRMKVLLDWMIQEA